MGYLRKSPTVTRQGGEIGDANEKTAIPSNTSSTDQQPIIPSKTMQCSLIPIIHKQRLSQEQVTQMANYIELLSSRDKTVDTVRLQSELLVNL